MAAARVIALLRRLFRRGQRWPWWAWALLAVALRYATRRRAMRHRAPNLDALAATLSGQWAQ
jgi:hypothetical protein